MAHEKAQLAVPTAPPATARKLTTTGLQPADARMRPSMYGNHSTTNVPTIAAVR